jgi:tricorn protease
MNLRKTAIMMIMLLAMAAAAFSATLAGNNVGEQQGFFRYPNIYQDKIVFTSEGDLWMVSASGGTALRMTTAEGEERFAKISPDGKWIAFTGEYDGNADVYVMPVAGGEPKRLTYHPWGDHVVGWSPDGTIIYRSFMESGNYTYKLFAISPTGGFPERLPLDQGATLTYEPNGPRVAFTRAMLAFRTWKRYHGGWAEDIWVGNWQTREFKKITTYTGNDQFPMWVGDRIFYLSDSTGRANIWSMKPDGSDLKQITTHTDYDIRWPSASGDKIVYQLAMDIWMLDLKSGKTAKVDITLPSDRLQRRTKFVDAKTSIDDFDLSPDGKRMVVTARGELFSVSTRKDGLTRRLSFSPVAREKKASFSPDSKNVLAVSDAAGEEDFWLYDATGAKTPVQLTNSKQGYPYDPVWSPDGKWIAYSDNKCLLYLFNIASKTAAPIDSGGSEIRQYSWSPDSRYLAYSTSLSTGYVSYGATTAAGYKVIKVYDLTTKQSQIVTEPLFNSFSPSWDPDGKYLYFLQDATFNPRLCHVEARFIFDEVTKPFLVVLKATDKSPFIANAEGKEDEKGDEEKGADTDKKDKGKDKDKGKKEDSVKVQIDFANIVNRKVGIKVPAGNYGQLRAIKDKVYFLSYKDRGMMPEGKVEEGEGPHALHLYDMKEKKDTVVIEGIASYDISDDNSVVVVKKEDQFIQMEAGAAEAPKEEDKDAIVNLDGVTLEINPRNEWKQMYNEAWRLERDFFYDPNMHGLNWPKVREQYGGLIDRISTREELNDLIGETISELSAGHTYVWGGDKRAAKPIPVGLLGADVTVDKASGKYRIARILAPHPGTPGECSPLAEPGIDVKVGDFLLAIDNQPVDGADYYLKYLVNKADKLVQLTVNDKPTLTGARQVIVKPMASEDQLRYTDWVEGRRAYVEKASGGRLGYIYMSNMDAAGLSEFGWQYPPQFTKEGLILDVRYNGGGFVAEMILSHLARKVWSFGPPGRYGVVSPFPTDAFFGYMAVVCNGETGSDGETFTEGAKALQLGPVIGERTWGGWVGIRSDKPLADQGMVTLPEQPGWGLNGKWIIEGWGSVPDIEVTEDPASIMAGKDPQLDYTIQYLLKKIVEEPRKYPARPAFPDRSIK